MLIDAVSEEDLPGAADMAISQRDGNVENERLTPTTTPPVSELYNEVLTGTQNLDLTALSRTNLSTLDATDLKLQALRLENLSTTNTVTIQDGASNPYQLNAGNSILVQVGGREFKTFNDELADVSGTAKNLTISATAGQTYRLTMLFG